MIVFKKILAVSVALIMSLYAMIGAYSPVSEDYTQGKYKNVILMIGDGMGDNTIAATKAQKNVDLTMETMPVRGHSDTNSFLLTYTDSAAGGTALATGMRVICNTVAVFPFAFAVSIPNDSAVPITLCELAKANGKAAGVVTTDKTSGATPSDFSAHTISRKNEKGISCDQLRSGLDLIWGGATDSINSKNTACHGFTYIDSRADMLALESGSRSFAQFDADDLKYMTDNSDTPTIEEMTVKAIDLLDDDEDGFFLMVEGACIDKFSHDNDFDGATSSLVEFDKAIAAALRYAEADGETLVVVTADHETGGIKYDACKDVYYYTSTGHTTADVPLFVSATDAGFTQDETVKNREIGVQIARVMGYGEDKFPAMK
ncbi:MAG: alkaline phosphatase [Oscillospiraceae bacterium]|nr:alkaline phosphatase [Oscillospiraceae bacterium]